METKRKTGRPALKEGKRKTTSITFKIREVERSALETLVKREDEYDYISEFIRYVLKENLLYNKYLKEILGKV